MRCVSVVFQVVHTGKAIKEGEEITIAYNHVTSITVAKRKERMTRRGFVCDCQLCRLDSAEPDAVLRQRDALMEEAQSLITPYQSSVGQERIAPAKILKRHWKLIEKLEQSYATGRRSQLKVALANAYWNHATCVPSPVEGVHLTEKSLACCGISLARLKECAASGDMDIFGQDAVAWSGLAEVLTKMVKMAVVNGLDGDGRLRAAVELVSRVTMGATKQMVNDMFFGNLLWSDLERWNYRDVFFSTFLYGLPRVFCVR